MDFALLTGIPIWVVFISAEYKWGLNEFVVNGEENPQFVLRLRLN